MSSFLDQLDPEARDLLLSVARPVAFPSGATLVRHGAPARGAYVLREGAVEAVVTLPGGESLTVAKLGAGGVFGEMALIELGTCTATVRATAHVDGWFIAHEDFRALVSQRQPPALRLQHAITVILAEKLGALNTQLLACSASEDRLARSPAPSGEPLAEVARMRTPSFDVAAFLPRLPLFERCCAEEIDEFVSRARYLEIPRGQAIYCVGEEANAAYIVIRGAVEIVAARDAMERRLSILGPGQLVGYLGVLRQSRHSTHAFAREAAVLLEFPGEVFRELYFGPTRASALLRQAVQAALLAAMARTNRTLTRLLSQAKLDAARPAEAELQAAYHSQLATAAPA